MVGFPALDDKEPGFSDQLHDLKGLIFLKCLVTLPMVLGRCFQHSDLDQFVVIKLLFNLNQRFPAQALFTICTTGFRE